MANKLPGFGIRKGMWHLDRTINGHRYTETPGFSADQRNAAEQWYHRRIASIIEAQTLGKRPRRKFQQAAEEYIERNSSNATIKDDIIRLTRLCEYVGDTYIDEIHNEHRSLVSFKASISNLSPKTTNNYLEILSRVLKACATKWRDEHGLTWLASAPWIEKAKLHKGNTRQARVLQWSEQQFLSDLPAHQHHMALYMLNTGLRSDSELCQLKWDWEYDSNVGPIFVIPGWEHGQKITKTGADRAVLHNRVAAATIESRRALGEDYVFTFKGKPLTQMNNTSWQKWRRRNNLEGLRVHDLRHTFAHRLRAVGCPLEDRQFLLGHTEQSITEHYSQPGLMMLISWLEQIVDAPKGKPLLRVVNR